MTTELQTERIGSTQIMTLVGPATRNTLSPQVFAAGIELLNVAESNDDVRAVILTGANGHFCAGSDLQRLAHNRQQNLGVVGEQMDAFHQWIEALRSFPKPVIAAIEGMTAGSGLSLALACDWVIAAENARFATAYAHMGLSPDGGASWHLSRTLGRGPAMQLLLQSEPISSQLMAQWGVVHQISPEGKTLGEAIRWAEQLTQIPAGVVASIKELVNQAANSPLKQQLDAEKQQYIVNLSSREAGTRLDEFLKRKS